MAATAAGGRRPGLLIVALVAAAMLGPVLPSAGAAAAGAPATAVPPACGAALPSSGTPGIVTVDGGPLASSGVGGIPIIYGYDVGFAAIDPQTGVVLASGCQVDQRTTSTAANGSFEVVPVLASSDCDPVLAETQCTVSSAAEEPLTVDLADGAPAGYATTVDVTPARVSVGLLWELARVGIVPAGPTVVTAPGASVTFQAVALAADEAPSPLPVSFAWQLNDTGWAFRGPTTGATVTLSAGPGAGVARLSVTAAPSPAIPGVPAVTADVELKAIPTAIEAGQANRSALDAGGSVALSFTAVGAEGLNYTATIDPGLGLPPVDAACSHGTASGGALPLSCSGVVAYPSPGVAQPTATLTNGYSSASWQFPPIEIAPAPVLSAYPEQPTGYVADPLELSVVAENGSGTPPYQGACLAPGEGPATCRGTAGPVWEFDPTYPVAGNYTAVAWSYDAEGTNASVAIPVRIVGDLAVGPIAVGGGNLTVGTPAALTANVSGGLLPLRYWWNGSGAVGSIAVGELAADGPAAALLLPGAPGAVEVTLTVVDALGTVLAADRLLQVGPAPGSLVASVSPPPTGPLVAGAPTVLAWGAFLGPGVPDPAFAVATELRVVVADGVPRAWANASGVGALAELGNGTFGIPASAWVGGTLNLSLRFATAGNVTVVLAGAGLPNAVSPVNLTIAPDLEHVVLSGPAVATPGPRANATLWHVSDRFGNPAPGALLTVRLDFGSVQAADVVAAVPVAGGAGVWINYTAPSRSAGEVLVVDAAGTVVLGPLPVPAAPGVAGAPVAVITLAAAAPIGAAGAAAFAVVRRRRRTVESGDGEEALRRWAEGRAQVTGIVEDAGAVDLAGIEAAWRPGPAPPALADWLASLVADGTLAATVGSDGRPRFCAAERPAGSPQLTLDADARDRSLRRRDDELGSSGPD